MLFCTYIDMIIPQVASRSTPLLKHRAGLALVGRKGLNIALNMIGVLGLCLLACGCSPSKPAVEAPNLDEGLKDKPLPFNQLLNGPFPPLRQDSFYTTYVEPGGEAALLHDRFVSNGKGFVAYCQKEGFDEGYYLYNFYGHSSFYVQIKDRTYKVALTSPGDDIISAFQVLIANSTFKPLPGQPVATKLPAKKIDGFDCLGITYTAKDGAKHEEWFDMKTRCLVDQTIESKGKKLSRHLKRFNAFCETMLLRMPQGFTLEKGEVSKVNGELKN